MFLQNRSSPDTSLDRDDRRGPLSAVAWLCNRACYQAPPKHPNGAGAEGSAAASAVASAAALSTP
jgi:hypothetical protein